MDRKRKKMLQMMGREREEECLGKEKGYQREKQG